MGKKGLKKITLLTISAMALGSIALADSFFEPVFSGVFAKVENSLCSWNHYAKLDPTYNDNGSKEYWVCCTHHDFSLDEPSAGTISPLAYPDASFSNSLSDDDGRVILSYSKQCAKLDSRISALFAKGSVSFDDYWELQECRHLFDSLGDYQKYVGKADELTYLESRFKSKYDVLAKGNELAFGNRNYGSTYDLSYVENEIGMPIAKMENIKGSDTFWIYPDSSFSLANYDNIYVYVRVGSAVSLQNRMKNSYTASKTYALEKDKWTLLKIDVSDASLLSEVGFAIWKGSSFSFDFSLEFSSFCGEKKDDSNDMLLLDAKSDGFVNNDYPLSFDLSHINDETKGDLIKISNISSEKEWIWLKPELSKSLNGLSHIYFDMMVDTDTNIEFKETSTSYGNRFKTMKLNANEWQRVVISISDESFPSSNLSNLGIAKYSDTGTHTVSSSGNWYFSSIYGVVDTSSNEYECVDGKWIPSFKKDGDFDITAYAMTKINSSNADKVLKDAKDGGFNKITTLYDGRDSDAESVFVTALKDYCKTLIINKDKKLETLLNAVDSFCAAVKENNVYGISKANEYGIKTVSMVNILYDLDSYASSQSITISDDLYAKIAERVFKNLDYTDTSGYEGLFLKDEPSVTTDFGRYKTAIESYQNTYGLKGTPYMNLLPLGDDGNSSKYSTYLDNYFNNVYPLLHYASFDQYPVKADTTIMKNHLRNLSDFASRIKNSSVSGELRTFIHSALESDSTNDIAGISSAADLTFQMYSNMAFGSKDISYFVYSSNNDVDNGLANYSTYEKTSLYDYAKEANEEILSFASAYSYFDFGGAMGIGTCDQFSAIVNPLSSLTDLSVSASSNILASEFASGSQNAYLLTNYASPSKAGEATVTLSFDSKYNYILSYNNGMKGLLANQGDVSISIASGSGAFLIPLSL